ncbi:unnamed protein product [Moneuplotes crassus]|uniref:Uncharacterized protein n=1 Tax=Euplotes crassus TaxID=5936 RepID=A0AAD2DAC4_EUPCR|nr:unnamed protein product [Moneuplotes crassus]
MSSLDAAISTNQFFKLGALLKEAKGLEDFVMNSQLFIKHSVAKNWKDTLAVVEGTIEMSAALVTKELREEYDRLLERTASKLKQQKDRILEEKIRIETELSIKKTKIKEVKDEFKEQKKSHMQNLKKQKEGYERIIQDEIEQSKKILMTELSIKDTKIRKLKDKLKRQKNSRLQNLAEEEGYKEKIQDLKNTKEEIEKSKKILIDKAHEKDLQIAELKKKIKSKSDELKGSHENIKQLKQKVNANIKKENDLRSRIAELESQLNSQKEQLEEHHRARIAELESKLNSEKEHHNDRLRILRADYEAKLEESREENKKDQLEKLDIFNNCYKIKNDAINELEAKVSDITNDLAKERAEHQTLSIIHNYKPNTEANLCRSSQCETKYFERTRCRECKIKERFPKNLEDKQNFFEQEFMNAKSLYKDQIDDKEKCLQKEIAKLKEKVEIIKAIKNAQNYEIINKEKQIKSTQKKLGLTLKENKLLEQQLFPLTTYTPKDFAAFCRSIDQHFLKVFYGWSGDIDYKEGRTSLDLNLDRTTNLELIKRARKRIPDIEHFSISSIEAKYSQNISKFLPNCFPNKVQTFKLCSNLISDVISMDHYIEVLLAIAPRVQKELRISKFSIYQLNLVSLLLNFKHVECFQLFECEIDLHFIPNLQEALRDTQIKRLDLCYKSNLEDNIPYFERLIKGFAKSEDFRESFQEITVGNLQLTEEEVSSILEENGFEKVKVQFC